MAHAHPNHRANTTHPHWFWILISVATFLLAALWSKPLG